MSIRTRKIIAIILSGFFLFLDRFLKWQTLHEWREPALINKFFGWKPFFNPGVAFGIPVPNFLTIIFTIPVIVFILWVIVHQWKQDSTVVGTESTNRLGSFSLPSFSFFFILTGAVSNFFDRVVYHFTVDYFLFATGVINIADILIVVGFVIYLYSFKHENTRTLKY